MVGFQFGLVPYTKFVTDTKFTHLLNAINVPLLRDKLLQRDTSKKCYRSPKLVKYNINRNGDIDHLFRSVVSSAHKSTNETSAIAAPAKNFALSSAEI
jgi:hypothetical protein